MSSAEVSTTEISTTEISNTGISTTGISTTGRLKPRHRGNDHTKSAFADYRRHLDRDRGARSVPGWRGRRLIHVNEASRSL